MLLKDVIEFGLVVLTQGCMHYLGINTRTALIHFILFGKDFHVEITEALPSL